MICSTETQQVSGGKILSSLTMMHIVLPFTKLK